MNWFTSNKLSDHVYEIMDITGVRMFLIEGDKSAVLVDTGTGAGDLKAYVEGLTKLPITVVLTHGHVDHGGGIKGFERVYLHQNDWQLISKHCSVEMKTGYIQLLTNNGLSEDQLAELDETSNEGLLALEDGQVFDLGGVSLEVILVPGHTKGMSCVLIPEEKTLILGDAANDRVFLFDDEATTVSEYIDSLTGLLTKAHGFDTTWFSHGPAEGPKAIIQGCLDLAQEILVGTDDREPFEFMGQPGFLGKKTGEDGIFRQDGGRGNILYAPNKVK